MSAVVAAASSCLQVSAQKPAHSAPSCLFLSEESPHNLAVGTFLRRSKERDHVLYEQHQYYSMSTNEFVTSLETAEDILSKAQDVAKGKSLAEAGIDGKWMRAYATIAKRCRDDKDFGLTRYPYEQGPSVGAFTGGFFEHREWPLRKAMESHKSMRAVFEYEANYTNAAGYWMAFHEAALSLRQDELEEKNMEKAKLYDVWSIIAIRYALRVTGLRCEFYKMVSKDPTYAKLIMPSLEKRNDVPAADDLVGPLEKLDTHMSTQLMKAVATLSASNATKRAGKGGAAGDN